MVFYHLQENIRNNYWIKDQMLPKKVVHKAGEFVIKLQMQHCQKSNDDNIEKQEPAEEIIIPPEKKRRNQSLPGKKQCVYCNSYEWENLRVRCSLNYEFGTYNVKKCIFIFFNVNKVPHVNYTRLLFWKCYFTYYQYIQHIKS